MGVRLAIISSPRSGNAWLHGLLSSALNLKGIGACSPDNIVWADLPINTILMIHWHRTAEFRQQLNNFGFRVVTIARHPLDTLLSILHYASQPGTGHWLAGEHGDESAIYGVAPGSPEFIDYACSGRASALLGITAEWWADDLHLRFEDLIADPIAVVRDFAAALDAKVSHLDVAVFYNSLRHLGKNHHRWQGKVGLWRKVFTVPLAHKLRIVHAGLMRLGGYGGVADSALTPEQANQNWSALCNT